MKESRKLIVTLVILYLNIVCVACVGELEKDNIVETGYTDIMDFDYEIKQMHSGKILFTIKGTWGNDHYWSNDTKIKKDIFIHEDFVGESMVVYFLENTSSKAGFTEIELSLKETATEYVKCKCILLVVADDKGNINVDQVLYINGDEA